MPLPLSPPSWRVLSLKVSCSLLERWAEGLSERLLGQMDTSSSGPCADAVCAHPRIPAVINRSPVALWELRRHDGFVSHSRNQVIRLPCVHEGTSVVVPGVQRSIFFYASNFVPVYTHAHTLFLCTSDTTNISDDNDASGEAKRAILSLRFASAFLLPINQRSSCSYTQLFTRTCHTRLLDKCSQASVPLEACGGTQCASEAARLFQKQRTGKKESTQHILR